MYSLEVRKKAVPVPLIGVTLTAQMSRSVYKIRVVTMMLRGYITATDGGGIENACLYTFLQ